MKEDDLNRAIREALQEGHELVWNVAGAVLEKTGLASITLAKVRSRLNTMVKAGVAERHQTVHKGAHCHAFRLKA